MRGTILGYDAASGEGVINDAGGGRIKFSRSDWKSPGEPSAGRQVDFDMEGDRAADIYVVPGSAPALNFGTGGDQSQAALTSGIVSLVCGVLTFLFWPLAIVTLPVSIIFGIKGKKEGADLPDKTGYYLSIAGLLLSGLALLVLLVGIAACVSGVALLSTSGYWLH